MSERGGERSRRRQTGQILLSDGTGQTLQRSSMLHSAVSEIFALPLGWMPAGSAKHALDFGGQACLNRIVPHFSPYASTTISRTTDVAKPWARYEQNYINHPKFLALTANAICLWIEGKNYCDLHQTDGFIPQKSLKTFRFFSQKSLKLLTVSHGNHDGIAWAPLWETIADLPSCFHMHDYLDYNDCREQVLARIDLADDRRDQDRRRKADARAAKARLSARMSDVCPSGQVADSPRTVPSKVRSITETTTETEREKSAGLSASEQENAHPVAAFMRVIYPTLYAKARNGATYRLNEVRDFETCVTLVDTYGDRLPLILEYFLYMPPGKDVLNQPGTPRQLLHMAPICDAELRQAGR